MQDRAVKRIIQKLIILSYMGRWADIQKAIDEHRAILLDEQTEHILSQMIMDHDDQTVQPILIGLQTLLQRYKSRSPDFGNVMPQTGLKSLQSICSTNDFNSVVAEFPELLEIPGVTSIKILLFLHEVIQAAQIQETHTSGAYSLVQEHETWLCGDFIRDLLAWKDNGSEQVDPIGRTVIVLGLHVLASVLSSHAHDNACFIAVADTCHEVAKGLSY